MELLLATFLDMLLAVIATEAATNLLTKSEFGSRFIKEPLFNRKHIKFFKFIHDILDCGYCTSVWVACIFALFFITDTFGWLMVILAVHRLSNILHFCIDRLDRTRDLTIDFEREGEDNE